MNLLTYGFRIEPTNADYYDLLAFSLQYCKYFQLIQRSAAALNQEGVACRSLLSQFIVNEENVFEWPGTILLQGKPAKLMQFRFTTESLAVLIKLTEGPFCWRHPDRLEDLSIFREDRTPFLVSTAHEKECFLSLTEKEYQALPVQIPAIQNLIHPDE